MTTSPSQHLSELTRQARARVASAERLREEQRIIAAQSGRRLADSRALLDAALQRIDRRDAVPAVGRQV